MSLLSSRHNLQCWISVSGAWGVGVDSFVTVSGVQLLTTQKPIKSPAWWKEKFALFWMLAQEVGQTPVQKPTPPH